MENSNSKNGLLTAVVYFDDNVNVKADMLEYYYRTVPVKRSIWRYAFTLIVDLVQSEEELLESFTKDTVRKIRKAQKDDGIKICFNAEPEEKDIVEFESLYNQHAAESGMSVLETWHLKELTGKKALVLSNVKDADGKLLVSHCYCSHEISSRALMLHSVSIANSDNDSQFRNLIGRVNRLLHYEDMLAFKKMGFKIYDFCGYYAGKSDEKLLNINRFKDGFGGKLVAAYSGETACSLKGWFYLFFRELRNSLFKRSVLHQRKQRMMDSRSKLIEINSSK